MLLYSQKRYLIADTRKPLREKALVRKTDTFTRSSRRKVIPGQALAGHGAAVQGWRKGTRRRSEWEGAEDCTRDHRTPGSLSDDCWLPDPPHCTRDHRTPGSLGVDCWLPDPPLHKSCLPQLHVLRAHTGALQVCFCFMDDWLFGSGSRAGLGAVEITEKAESLSCISIHRPGKVGALCDVWADPAQEALGRCMHGVTAP